MSRQSFVDSEFSSTSCRIRSISDCHMNEVNVNLSLKENPAKQRLKEQYMERYRKILGFTTVQIREKEQREMKVRIQDVQTILKGTTMIENAHKRLNKKVEDIILQKQPFCPAKMKFIIDTDDKLFYQVNRHPRIKDTNVLVNHPVFNTLFEDLMLNKYLTRDQLKEFNTSHNPYRQSCIQAIQSSGSVPSSCKRKLFLNMHLDPDANNQQESSIPLSSIEASIKSSIQNEKISPSNYDSGYNAEQSENQCNPSRRRNSNGSILKARKIKQLSGLDQQNISLNTNPVDGENELITYPNGLMNDDMLTKIYEDASVFGISNKSQKSRCRKTYASGKPYFAKSNDSKLINEQTKDQQYKREHSSSNQLNNECNNKSKPISTHDRKINAVSGIIDSTYKNNDKIYKQLALNDKLQEKIDPGNITYRSLYHKIIPRYSLEIQ